MSTLPDDLKANIESRRNRDVTIEDVAEILQNGDRPYYSVSQIRARLPQDVKSDPPIRARLGELIDADYVAEEQVGRMQLYWWNRPESGWPVPPDTEVAPVPDEMAISEFFEQPYVRKGAWGVGGIIVGSLFMILGAFLGTLTEGILYQAAIWAVGLSFFMSIAAFLVLFSSLYKFLRSDAKIFQ